jgi:hypothetical protein
MSDLDGKKAKIVGRPFSITTPDETLARLLRIVRAADPWRQPVAGDYSDTVARGNESDRRGALVRRILEEATLAMEAVIDALPSDVTGFKRQKAIEEILSSRIELSREKPARWIEELVRRNERQELIREASQEVC